MLCQELIGQKDEEARLLFKGAAEFLGWTNLEPVKEGGMDLTTLKPDRTVTCRGMSLAREFGFDAIYAKLKSYVEAHYEPTWDHANGEFTWGFGLDEPYPRGQYNAVIAVHEAGSLGARWRIYNKPNLKKFIEPTVYGVDFPAICLSQAWYDASRRTLMVSTDAGLPNAVGNTTSFRVSHVNVNNINVVIDDQLSDQWSIVDGELEITTKVGEHTIMISH